jgi:hypothetical protein
MAVFYFPFVRPAEDDRMTLVRLDCRRLVDWESFHTAFAEAFGFPLYYGRNMNAWIDCMSCLDEPGSGMTNVFARLAGWLLCSSTKSMILLLGALSCIPPWSKVRRLSIGGVHHRGSLQCWHWHTLNGLNPALQQTTGRQSGFEGKRRCQEPFRREAQLPRTGSLLDLLAESISQFVLFAESRLDETTIPNSGEPTAPACHGG